MIQQTGSDPLVSIVIVVFNSGEIVEQAIQSVLAQNYSNKELLVIDGKSGIDTLKSIERYKDHIDYFISEKDCGIYDAMNKGIQASNGEWVYFLGADDIFLNDNVLTEVFHASNYEKEGIVYGDVRFKSGNTRFGGERTYLQLIGKNISHQAIFYRKELLEKMKGYNLKYKILADYELNLRIFRDPTIQTRYLPIEICLFNDKGGASNLKIDRAFFQDQLEYFLKKDKLQPGNPLLQQYYFYTGFCGLLRDQDPGAFKNCLRAFTVGPRKVFYLLVFAKFLLGYGGIGKKITIV